jgi:hypothetical protein
VTTDENPASCANAGRGNLKANRTETRSSAEAREARVGALPGPPRKPHNAARKRGAIDFAGINRAALAAFPAVLARILPGGKRVGGEFFAYNPKRNDRSLGSFRVNLRSGKWADFACDARGGDIVSLCAYLQGCSQSQAARLLARMLGIEAGEPRHG